MFCSQCGNQLDSQSVFCTQCGFRLTTVQHQNQSPAQSYAAPTQEIVLWVFNAQRKFSMFKMTPCNIVFMQDKAVLAYLTPELQKAESAKVSQDIKSNGLGFFKGSAAMMRYWADYNKKYYAMGSNAILAEDPSNVVLYYQNITEVLFKGFSETVSTDDSTSSVTQGKLHFSLVGGEVIKFTHSLSSGREVKELFTKLFGAKLRYKR